jgi:CheY-like chemotaxis protein
LRVSDDGTGISEAVAKQMFTPFFTTKGPGQGTGLGLSSVLEIVTSHSGGIHVRSKYGVGTIFMILLPQAEEHAGVATMLLSPHAKGADEWVAPAAAGAETTGSDVDIRPEARILVVDDEERLVELATAILEKIGYEVEGFSDPRAAAKRFADAPDAFDLLLTDQTMPEMSGSELILLARAVRPDLKAVICTGYSRDVDRSNGLPLAVTFVLSKPYTPSRLANIVREALSA